MADCPLVSVIIPVYNGEPYLAEALKGVLSQAYRPLEVIVLNDGSTDGSAAVAQRFPPPVCTVHQARAGAGAARNHGVALTSGAFVAFLDADDLWATDKLPRQMSAFDADPELDLTFGHVQQFISPELGQAQKARLVCPDEAIPGYLPGAMLGKRAAFNRVGPFRVDLRVGEFVDWYSRAMDLGLRSVLLPDVLLKRRLHATNLSLGGGQNRMDFVRVAKAALDRRRNANRKDG